MSSSLSPIPLLLILVVAAVGSAGWIHSYRWEQEAIKAEQAAAAAIEAARSKKSKTTVSVPMPDRESDGEGPPQAVIGLELTSEEQVILDLQNQLDRLRSENESLSLQMRELMEPAPEAPEGAKLGAKKTQPEIEGGSE